jgi:hypothetical protein
LVRVPCKIRLAMAVPIVAMLLLVVGRELLTD